MNIQAPATEAQLRAKTLRQKLMGTKPKSRNIAQEKATASELLRMKGLVASLQILLTKYEQDAIERERERLELVALLEGKAISDAVAAAVEEKGTERLSVRQIVMGELDKFPGITYDMVVGPTVQRSVVAARHHCIYEVHVRRPDMSLPQIGSRFGGRDHTTVMHAIKKIRRQRGYEV